MSSLTLGITRIASGQMRATILGLRARPFTSILSLLLVPLFSYANLLCVAGASGDEECEREAEHNYLTVPGGHNPCGAEANHQPKQDPKHQHHECSRDSCFCATMYTVVAQQTVAKPTQVIRLPWLDF